jgi:tetratricopeptide (TPR) repeat protein
MENDAQLEEMLELVSSRVAAEGVPGYRKLVRDLDAARARRDRGAEASLGLMLGTLLTATARSIAAIGPRPGFPDLTTVNERTIAELKAALAAAEATGDAATERLVLLHLADCRLRGASPGDARPVIERLIDRCDTPDTDVLRYEAVSRLGDCDLTVGDAASALDAYGTALRLAEAVGDPAERASQLGKLASAFAALDRPAAALDHYRRSRELWVRIRDDALVRDQVVLHAGLLEPGVDPIIADVDERIRAQAHAVRLLESRASLSPRQECHYRTASHCLSLMADLGRRWHSSGERLVTQLAFDVEWGLVRHNQAWAAEHVAELEVAAELCVAFGSTGRSLLDSRLAPADRLRWSQEALAVANTWGDREAQAGLYVNLANDEFDLGRVDDAYEHADQAYLLAQKLNRHEIAGKALFTLSQVHQLRGRFDLAHDALAEGRRLLGSFEEEDRYLTNQVALYAGAGDFATAVELGTRALEEAVREKDPAREASALANLGVAHHGLGNFETSLAYEERAVELFRKLGDRRAEVEALSNSAATHLELGDFEQAQRLLRESLARSREAGYRQGEEGALGNLAVVLRNTGHHGEAAAAFREVLEIARGRGHLAGEAAALHGLASVEFERGAYDTSAELFQRSFDIGRAMEHPEVCAKAALGLGQVEIAREDPRAALGRLDESAALARKAGNQHLEASVLHAVAVAAAGLERYDQARTAAANARSIAESRGYTDIVSAVDRLVKSLPQSEVRVIMDTEEELYQSAVSAIPYLRRDGVSGYFSYFEGAHAAEGERVLDALAGEAESGLTLLNEALAISDDEETQRKYTLIFLGSIRRAAAEVASTRPVDPTSFEDPHDQSARVLAMMVAIWALARFPNDLATVAQELYKKQRDA